MDPDLSMRDDLAFYVNVVVTGAVLGAAPSHAPDDVTARLGADFAENRIGACMWRDYGAVEFFWERSHDSTGYRGMHFSIQVHRLDNDPEQMNDAVRRVYGGFRCRLRFAELTAALAGLGGELLEVARPAWDVREFVYSPTGVTILVATVEADTGLDAGDVWQISCLNPVEAVDGAEPPTRRGR